MSNRDQNILFSFLLDLIMKKEEIPLTSVPPELKEDLLFSQQLYKNDFSGQSQIRDALRNRLQEQAVFAVSKNIETASEQIHEEKKAADKSTLIGVGIGAAVLVLTTSLIIFRKPAKKVITELIDQAKQQETKLAQQIKAPKKITQEAAA
jgi:hypothetical protein